MQVEDRSLAERADELEAAMALELERVTPVKSVIYMSGERDPREGPIVKSRDPAYQNKLKLMGPDPRIPRLPKKPTLIDFFKLRFAAAHMLQSARLARLNGLSDTIVLACLLHDISVAGFIQGDHGYWGAQLVEPYVDEEITWAIRAHQALRFYPDPDVGYEYPEVYVTNFGADYVPDPHIQRAYEQARKHKWYMTARMITVWDIYSFDPDVHVEIDDFSDLIDKHFRTPEEGLGFDESPVAHMWRTMNMPTRML